MKNSPVTICFDTTLYTLKQWTILAVPKEESAKLPSRGQVSVTGAVERRAFEAVLEPDGRWSHWMRLSEELQSVANVKPGDVVSVEITSGNAWPEPVIPDDLQQMLKAAPAAAQATWSGATPMARWEWVRWIQATLSQDTRALRVEKSISKLNAGHRRPCCFNLAACTEPYLMKGGTLMKPADSRIKIA